MNRLVRQPLWPGEVKAVSAACNTPREKLIVLALLETGLTAEELISLTAASVDWRNSRLRRREGSAPVHISSELLQLLRQHLRSGAGLGICVRQIQRIVRAIGRRAGLSGDLTPDVLRCTCRWSPLASSRSPELRGEILLEAARAASDVILVMDDERKYVELNLAAVTTIGLPREAILGRTLDDFFEEAEGQTIPAVWEQLVTAGERCGVCRLRMAGRCTFEYRARANFVPGLHVSVLRPVGLFDRNR
jgi:PAS domain-containing protein